MKTTLLAVIALLVVALLGCDRAPAGAAARPPRDLRIFHAAGLTPVLDAVRDDARRELGIRIQTESSGSQMACRKVTELGRDCDLLMLADNGLVKELLGGTCSWRLDFVNDEVVLGIGARAPRVSEAEKDWATVLLRPDVRLARVNENLGPIGYRALLVWKLREQRDAPGLCERLLKKADKVVDDVGQLTPLLKLGEIDYAFIYRSTAVAADIRTIPLDETINLGAADRDYSAAVVTYVKLKAGERQTVTVCGAPITWTLTIPDRGADAAGAREFIRWLLMKKADVLAKNGFRPLAPPRFYGSQAAFDAFSGLARRAGELGGEGAAHE